MFRSKTAYAYLTATAAAALLTALPASAQSQATPDPDSAVTIEDLIVTANRSAQRSDRVGSSVAVLNTEAIEASQTVAVVELLATTPGVSFVSNGGLGKSTSISIRGSSNQHTVVLMDGVKMNDPSSTQGSFNFGNLLVGDIARIEVLRGAQSTLWGSQAIGGVVNIITARPTAPLEASLDAEAGALGTRMIRAGLGGANDGLTWRLSASRFETDGVTAWRPGTEADGYENTGLSGRLEYDISDTVSIDLRSRWSDGRSEMDGWASPMGNYDSAEYSRTRELVTYAGLNFDLFDGLLSNRIGYSYTDTERRNFNPATTAQPLSFDAQGDTKRLEYQGVLTLSPNLTATFGGETETSEMRTRSPSAFDPNPAFIRGEAGIDSVYGQIQWTILGGLTLTSGLRYDDHETFGDNVVGQVAVAWSLNNGDTVLRSSFGQGFRAPSLYELYSLYGSTALNPETFDSWEIGVEQRFVGRAVATATYFKRDGDDELGWFDCWSDPTPALCSPGGAFRDGYYINRDKTKAQGVELFGQVSLTDRLNLDANYTWTESQYGSGANAGNQVTQRPEHMANLSVSYLWPNDLSTAVSARYVGETFTNAANTGILDDYTLVDVRASYPIDDNLEVYGRVQNVFDEDYQTIANYGTPGRGAYFGVRLRF